MTTLSLHSFPTEPGSGHTGAAGPEGREKLAGGGARYERNHRKPSLTRVRPGGGARTSAREKLLPPLQGGSVSFDSGGSATLHPRLISSGPPGRLHPRDDVVTAA